MVDGVRTEIKDFTNMRAWQEAHVLALAVYAVCKKFPAFENYALASQLRRAGVSVTSNLAEGWGRTSQKEKLQFYSIARGSLTETHNQLLLARDTGYVTKAEFDHLLQQLSLTHRLINGLIKSFA